MGNNIISIILIINKIKYTLLLILCHIIQLMGTNHSKWYSFV